MNRRELLKAGLVGGTGLSGLLLMGNQLGDGENEAPSRRTSTRTSTTRTTVPTDGEPTTTRRTATDTTQTESTTTDATAQEQTADEPTDSQPPDTETTSTADPVRHSGAFDTVVRAVDAGADPTGREPINPILEEFAGDDTLLSFESGTYRLAPTKLTDLSHFGIAAAYGRRPTFVPTNQACPTKGEPYLTFEGVSNLLVDSVDFDFRLGGSGGEIRIIAEGDATFSDVSAVGNCRAQTAMLRMDVTDEDGTGLFENVALSNHADNPSLTGIYVGKAHAGTLTVRNCDVRGFSGNGLYASPPGLPDGGNGAVHVRDGTYRNNNIANVRLGSTGASARDVEILVDRVPPEHVGVNARGIRLTDRADQVVENCTLRFGEDAGRSFGGVVFHPDSGHATVKDTEVVVNRDDVHGLRAFPFSGSEDEESEEGDGTGEPVFENVTVSGSAAGGHAALIAGRDGAVFRNCTVEQTGADRGGIYLRYSENCELVDSRIDVTGNPLVIRQSNVRIRNTTIVTPDGERHIEEMRAEDEDFTPRGSK
jgi:hypothetical protein